MTDFVEIQETELELNIVSNNLVEEQEKESQSQELKDNGTLLISEIQNKVVLPYTASEVQAIIDDENNYYRTPEEVINSKFTRPLSEYKDPYMARMKESVKLVTEREGYSKLDGYNLGLELFANRYLHPAIIAACKNLDELNVYLDCLDKNELDDFKIFEIKYELFPMIIGENKLVDKAKSWWLRIKEFFYKIISFGKKEGIVVSRGKH